MITRNCFLALLCSLLPGIQIHAIEKTLSARDGNSCQAIQAAIDTLPANRSHIATLTLKGEFQLKKSIRLPNFTRLDLRSAKLTLAAQSHAAMIVNADSDAGNHHLQIIGGLLDGRTADQGIGDYHGIEFTRVQTAHIIDTDIRNCSGDGIRLTGKGRHSRDLQLRGLRLYDNRRCGLNVMWAERNIFVSDVFAKGNGEVGIRSDHSEGLYQNIAADQNSGHGIFIRNIFGGTYNNLTATRNGGYGIHVQGMVCSRGSNWGAHNNSTQKPGKFPDLYFDANATLSYGISKHTVLSNLLAGNFHEYGPATSGQAVRFGPGVQAGLQIHNLMELK